ncbi:MAG: adenine phosphoribosyltransferase [Bdellovibrionaceae bacterium]|nr:adenine phosphoribosyltransferase [Pseudobdellovibrionaceae bacterium]
MDLKKYIREIPDFPKKGILFRDVGPLLKSPEALKYVAKNLGGGLQLSDIDYIAGIESRGFLFAMLLAAHFGKGFLPIRKAGKLPPPTVAVSYELEYGKASLELSPGEGRLLIVDDVLATGGTLQAAIDVSYFAGYQVQDVAVLINLSGLNQMKFKELPVRSLIQY